MSKSRCKFINLIHTRKIICSRSWKIINKMVLKCHLTWRMLTTLPSEKNGSVVTFAHAIMHQKHLAQSGRSLGTVRRVQWTFSIHSAYLLKSQSENNKFSWKVWMIYNDLLSHDHSSTSGYVTGNGHVTRDTSQHNTERRCGDDLVSCVIATQDYLLIIYFNHGD